MNRTATALAVLPLAVALLGAASPSEVIEKAHANLTTGQFSIPRGPNDSTELGEDKTLSPYFYVSGGNPETDRLPLKETSAKVDIAGVIARVRVKQVFENSGAKPIEAVYVFPASTRAAVHGMRMKIGARTIEAKIERKAAAREQYEQAKAEGKRASLLEQERANVFTMSVANIMPKDRIEVELDYSELLVPENAVYEFVYPTVVGPRYAGGADPKKDGWMASPTQGQGEKELYKFGITAHVETGIALKELSSPSHKVAVTYQNPSSADVRLDQEGGGNKDFVLHYRLAGDKVEAGLLAWQGEKENFFILMMEPPQKPTEAQMPPREYIFLLDVSGSMRGFPLDTAKGLMRELLGQLRPTDYFNVALFSGANYVMNPEGSLPATSANVSLAMDIIDRQSGGGGTELMGGLTGAYAIPKRDQGVSRSVVVVTDGYVGVEAKAYKFVRENLNQANLFAFGIGSSVNRGLIEGMARAGQGEPFVVLGPAKAKEQAEKLRQYIQYPVLSNISVTYSGFEAREVAPMKVPDLMARRPVILFGKYRGEPKGKITVSGFSGGGAWSQAIDVTPKAVKAENAPLRWLWARKWVAFLDDELAMTHAKEIEDAITDLGLSYSLLTTYTSFVAVDSEVANKTGKVEKVNQALPMPEGVSNSALSGGSVSPQAFQGSGAASKALSAGGAGMGSIGGPPSSPAPMPSASQPPPSPMRMRAAESEKKSMARPSSGRAMKEELADDEAVPAGQLRLMVADFKADKLSDAGALLRAIDAKLAEAKGCFTVAGSVKLRLTVDKAGKVIKVEVVSGDAKAGECFKAKLVGLSSTAKADGAATGTYEVTLRAIQLR
jgi:Ca-activated chloride channel family protein